MPHAPALVAGATRVPRVAVWNAVFIALSIGHGVVLLSTPPWYVIALALWWNANTISHNFIHRPFFRRPRSNRAFSLMLSLVLGFPQTIWRDRHLRHHAGLDEGFRLTRRATGETAAVAALFAVMFVSVPQFFLGSYLPGWALGLGLCWVHGHYEHARGTTSHYGRLYNLLFFNDGYHVEHHAHPAMHWSELTRLAASRGRASVWPAPLRWMELFSLSGLERIVLRSPALQRFVLRRHERAFRRLSSVLPPAPRITIVGGGLFPRTALVLQRIRPLADLTIVDADLAHLEMARRYLPDSVHFVHAHFDGRTTADADVVVTPLAYLGDRRQLYAAPPAGVVFIHDWIWAAQSRGVVVSWLLLKRLNRATR